MGNKPWFIIKYWLKWIVFFEMGRLLFLFKNHGLLRSISKTEALKTLWHGARMDMSLAAYITIPVILILLAGVYIPSLRKLIIMQVYTGIVTVFMLLLIMI